MDTDGYNSAKNFSLLVTNGAYMELLLVLSAEWDLPAELVWVLDYK